MADWAKRKPIASGLPRALASSVVNSSHAVVAAGGSMAGGGAGGGPTTRPVERLDSSALTSLLIHRNRLALALVHTVPVHDELARASKACGQSSEALSSSCELVSLPALDAPADQCQRCPQLNTCSLVHRCADTYYSFTEYFLLIRYELLQTYCSNTRTRTVFSIYSYTRTYSFMYFVYCLL